METAQSLTSIDCLHFEWFFPLYIDSTEKDLLQDVTFHSFWQQEIAGNKNREFPDLVPIPLPISGGVPLFLLIITRRMIDSDLWKLKIEGESN